MQKLNWSINLNPYRLSPTLDVPELYANTDWAVEQLRDLGVTMVRVDILWTLVQPAPDGFDAEAVTWYRHFFERLEQAGISVYAVLYNPPRWACDLVHADLEAFLGAWSRYCAMIGREFSDWVAIYQVWNEPNNYLSHLKDDFNLFHTKAFSLGGWKVTLPVGVHWKALVPLFRIAREQLPEGACIAYNAITNLNDFTPAAMPAWTEWEHFTDQLLSRAGDAIDVIAIDHYPDTWIPGVGPLAWSCIDEAAKRVNDPRSAWHGKTVILGELGYSSCQNVPILKRPRMNFFPDDHSEASMEAWYAEALPFLADRMRPDRWPHNRLHVVNAYELQDPPSESILGGEHHEVVGIEYHFGLLRSDRSPKTAYRVFQDVAAGRPLPVPGRAGRSKTGALNVYMKTSQASKTVHRWVSPLAYAIYQAVRPPLRRHDTGFLSFGALLILFQVWRAAIGKRAAE